MAESKGPTVSAVAIVFGVVAAVTITLRLWARVLIVKSVCADDSKSAFAMMPGIGFPLTRTQSSSVLLL